MACRVVVFLFVLSLISCKGGQKEQKKSQGKIAEVTDSTLIFDGKSLQGWEITNFGPQGPVYRTTTLMKFEKKHWYHICLTVTETEIMAMIDSTKVVDFIIGNNKLSIRPEVELSKPFGIASWNTTAAIRKIRIKRIEK
jgi:hypothetical protein